MDTLASNRMTALIARQRSSRVRDLVFAAALALGAALSLGAIHEAAGRASAPVAAASTTNGATG